jgi:hypothetical protein
MTRQKSFITLAPGYPIICGGRYPQFRRDCFAFENGLWIESASMVLKISNFEITPIPSMSIDLLLTGGDWINNYERIEQQKRVDILVGGSWKSTNLELPFGVAYHCTILKNDSTIVLIGGIQGPMLQNVLWP